MKTLLRLCLIISSLIGISNTRANAIAKPTAGSDATLSSISLSTATTLVYSTGPSNFNYTTSVSPGTASLTVDPTTNDPAATVTVNGVLVPRGSSSASITLNGIVTTTINLVVTAQDGVTTLSYSIVVYENGSNDAYLSGLSISTGNTLVASPSGPGTYNYTTSVSPATTSITVTPTTADPTATVSVGGVAVTSGTASGAIPLNASGTTTINAVVLAQDGVTTQTYSIIVSKTGSNIATLSALSVSTGTALIPASGSGSFSSGVFNYTTAVQSGTLTLTVTPVSTDANATIKVNGTAVISGHASGAISLNQAMGASTTINVVVTAQDGTTTQSYTIVVSTNGSSVATLSGLTISTGTTLVITAQGTNTTNYSTSVSSGTASVTVTPTATNANSIITVNGTVVSSGAASGAITLASNPTNITVVVKSQDATVTKTNTIAVYSNGSNNANLNTLTLSTNSTLIVTSQNSTSINYSTSVSTGTASLTVTPTAADPTATITVNATTVVSGTASGSLAINQTAGATTTITTVVTAQDGVTKKTYTIVLSTNGSNNANLSSTVLSTGTSLVSSTGSYNVNYTTSVSAGTTSLTVTPTAVDPSATITVNGVAVASGTASGSITLNPVGTPTTFVIVVQSQDVSVSKSYGITVSRVGSNIANLSTLTISTGTLSAPVTSGTTTNYTAAVSPNTNSLTITPTAVDPNATITVNGLAAFSGVASNTITLNATGTTPINVLVTAEDKITTRSYTITVSKTGATIAWTGLGTTGDWSLSANWVNTNTGVHQVPGSSDVATFGVSAYTGNQPIISAPISVAEVVFGPNTTPTTLTLNLLGGGATNKLTITNSLTISSSSTAIIQANKTAPPTIAAVDISPAATVTIFGTGVLQINTPISFTLKSSASGSASIGPISSTSITGTAASAINVERYITGGSNLYRGYRLLSSSVYKSTASGNSIYSLNYVQAMALVTGTTGAAGGFDRSGNPTIYLYRENIPPSSTTFIGGTYRGINNINGAPTYSLDNEALNYNVPVGNGFLFFFRGDRTTNAALKYSSTTSAESVTMTETGTINAGQIAVHDWFTPTSANLSYTGSSPVSVQGYNLVGNPYPSSIDWDTYNTTTPNTGIYAPQVTNAIYILDPVSKNFGVYMANSGISGTNNSTHIIPSGQGFFVVALNTSAQLTFNESAKTTAQVYGSNLLMGKPVENAVSQYLHLKLNKDSSQVDEIYISFNNGAKSQYAINEDAPQKPGFGIASLASMSSDGVPLTINKLQLPEQSEAIALNVNATNDGTFQLSLPEIKSVPAVYNVWLMDAYKKDSVNMKQNPNYTFSILKSDSASFGAKRFSLVIRQDPALGLRLLNFAATKASNGAQIVWKTVNEENYTKFTVERSTDGGATYHILGGFGSSALGTYSFIDKDPLNTTNRYRLQLTDLNGAITYSNIVTLIYGNSGNITSNISIYPNPASSTINLAITPFSGSSALLTNLNHTLAAPANAPAMYDIKIINASGFIIKTATSSSSNWQANVSGLTPGTYIVQVVNNSDKSVVGKSTFVKY